LQFSTPGMPGVTSNAIALSSGGGGGGGGGSGTSFATPNLLNNLSFETDWDGFTDGGAGPPTGVSRDNSLAFDGSWSVKRTWAPSSTDLGTGFWHSFASADHVWLRFYFRITAPVSTIMKFARFYS